MPLKLTPEQAKALGIVDGPKTRKRTRHAAVGCPYLWRCQCGLDGTGETAAVRHLDESRHLRYTTLIERQTDG